MPPGKGILSIDLDAARAARREKLDKKKIRFDGRTHDLPLELPAEYAFAWSTQRYNEAIGALLGADSAAAFAKWASLEDYWEFGRQVEKIYGVDGEGGSPASGDS